MKRSEFLRNMAAISAGTAFGVNGLTGKAYAHNPLMLDLAGTNGQILVLVQLSGGNDGMNTVVPFEDANYYNKRSTVNIAKSAVLPLNSTLGLHPSLAGLRNLYEDNKLSVLMNVGYASPNRSHFRSSDIWMTASDATQVVTDGWAARYLTAKSPGFPVTMPEQPLAIQLGSVESLVLLSQMGTTATVFEDPTQFFQLVNGSSADTDPPPATLAGEELKFLKQIELQSIQYSGIIKQKADAGVNTSAYPNTNLGRQLGIVAKLISGGIQTPVYLVTIGGFDTHANQLTQHANLLKQVSDAISTFQADLEKQGKADNVTLMTFSEFGRRLTQNGTAGTDHGTAAPLFVVGKSVRGGVLGGNPNLTDLDSSGDIKPKFDFREIYSTVLRDHLGMSDTEASGVLLGKSFAKLPIYKISAEQDPSLAPFVLGQNTPNPCGDSTMIALDINREQTVRLSLHDLQGRELTVLREATLSVGSYRIPVNTAELPSGMYLYALRTDYGQKVLRMQVAH